jgi:hypothetical protein
VAYNGYHRFCEGALVILDQAFGKSLSKNRNGKELACVMRENHSAGIPSFVAFSQDMGKTWSKPQMMPFAIHRPYAKQLPDGRVLVTGRHVNGGFGTYGWCGDLHGEAGTYQIGGPRCDYTANLTDEALVIDNGPNLECRYTLLPPESSRTEVFFEAEVKADGPENKTVAFMSISRLIGGRGPMILYIAPNNVTFMRESIEFSEPMDMTQYRKITIHHRRGLCQVHIDGKLIFRTRVHREETSASDFHGGNIARRTQFGQFGDEGQSFWKMIDYSLKTPTLDDFKWAWEAESGERPDEYQRQRMIQIHGNTPDRPDHGYSSWLALEDGRIILVDYTNFGDNPGKSHLVGVYLDPEDIVQK